MFSLSTKKLLVEMSCCATRRISSLYSMCYVILSETKDLKDCTTIHSLGALEILHTVQNDSVYSVFVSALCYVMLSEVEASPRWLCAVNAGCRWSALRRFFTPFRMTERSVQNDTLLRHCESRLARGNLTFLITNYSF